MLRTHTQTAGSTLTLQQPENNIVRAAVQALAAALGGVQSMALSCFDEAIAIPTQHAQTLAVRTQQMLQHEFGITDVADPLGGSWYVEQLTDAARSRGAAADGRRSMRMGGAVAAVETGFYQQTIADEAYAQGAADRRPGEDVVVGVNAFVDDEPERTPEHFDVPAGAGRGSAPAAASGARRSATAGGRRGALGTAQSAAALDVNLMPAIVAAVRARCHARRDLRGAASGVRRVPARRRRCRSDHGGSAPRDGRVLYHPAPVRAVPEFPAPLDRAVRQLQSGGMVVVCDDPDRENEGDLCLAAEFVTAEKIAFMACEARGLICLSLPPHRCDELELPLMVPHQNGNEATGFTVSIEAVDRGHDRHFRGRSRPHHPGCDRSRLRPERSQSARARLPVAGPPARGARAPRPDRGLGRSHPLAGLTPGGILCELMNEDGTMARGPQLAAFCRRHSLPIITVEEIASYLRQLEPAIAQV